MASQTAIVGTGVEDASVGAGAWTSPGNITASDDTRANRTVASGVVTRYLKGTNCGFTVPAGATIDGIVVEIDRHKTVAASQIRDSEVKIVKADGTIGSTNKGATSTDWPQTAAAEAVATYGSSSDLWGETWTPADVNDADFGAVVNATNPSATSGTANVDFIRITVHYTPAGGATVERSVSVNATAEITTAATFWSIFERSVAVGATATVAVVGKRELLRSASLTAAADIVVAGQRDLLRSASVDAQVAISTAAIRELLRSVSVSAVAVIEVSGTTGARDWTYSHTASATYNNDDDWTYTPVTG